MAIRERSSKNVNNILRLIILTLCFADHILEPIEIPVEVADYEPRCEHFPKIGFDATSDAGT